MKKIIFLIFLFIPTTCYGATYYISNSGSDINNGTALAPWSSFAVAFSRMSGGDTLIIRDGTYTQQIIDPPSGTEGNYTKIQAENNFRVTVLAMNALSISGRSYVRVEGIKFDANGNGQAGTLISDNHIKIIRCSFSGATTSDWNIMAVSTTSCSYILFEECWAWGTGRYKFLAYQSNQVIFRRCVARHDYHPSTQCSGFTRYDSPNVEFQNCIVIDSGLTDHSNGALYGAIWSENNAQVDTTGKNLGCIFLNIKGAAVLGDYKVNGTRTIENCVIWDAPLGINAGNYYNLNGEMYCNNLTVGAIANDGSWEAGEGIYDQLGMNFSSVQNSIITECAVVGVKSITESDYNCLYGNIDNYSGVSVGAHDITSNPGLKYLVRVESASPVKGAASNGGDIGATVLKQYGAAETLWGDLGYETLTNDNLWPFPNEDEIRNDMRTWAGGYVSGTRGFCADGQTLTKYIWGYLGNPVPFLVPPSGLSAVFNSGSTLSNEINLTWEDNSLEEAGYRIEKKEGQFGLWMQIAEVGANITQYNDTDIISEQAYYYRVKAFNVSEETNYSNEALAIADISAVNLSASGSSGGGGCFIATAVFGTPMAQEVISLCRFRDNYLLSSWAGRVFVDGYYKYSPSIADSIRDRQSVRAFVRILLRPLIFFSKFFN
ncbi:MAG: hypothetical protein KKD05_11345 [Candidatus Omnitrophica bacterium]|nr:hypothetical protein [Candidatus Omnitrophota bacterium]